MRRDEPSTMSIPTRAHCLLLMEHVAMPLHIQKHSLMVAQIALYLGGLLNQNSIRLDLKLLEAGALLHDIAKPRSLRTGESHDELGARMLEKWGYRPLAPIVREHVTLDAGRAGGPVTESLLVNYADKRVMHDRVVTLEERFSDLVVRYAMNPEQRAFMREKLGLYRLLEARIFEHLSIAPTDAQLMEMRVRGEGREGESEGYGGEKDSGGAAGGGEVF